jgi:hypothetical protein
LQGIFRLLARFVTRLTALAASKRKKLYYVLHGAHELVLFISLFYFSCNAPENGGSGRGAKIKQHAALLIINERFLFDVFLCYVLSLTTRHKALCQCYSRGWVGQTCFFCPCWLLRLLDSQFCDRCLPLWAMGREWTIRKALTCIEIFTALACSIPY